MRRLALPRSHALRAAPHKQTRLAGPLAAAALALSVAGCIPGPPATAPAPAPVQRPAPAPAPAPATPSPAPTPQDWRDAPRSPGDWSWGQTSQGSTASYGNLFQMQCDKASRTVTLVRMLPAGSASTGGALTITTDQGTNAVSTRPSAAGAAARLAATTPLLDSMAFTRGRFAVAMPGQPTLYLPSWTEISRVIEDCR